MSVGAVLPILEILNSSGALEILKGFSSKSGTAEKMKLEFIKILIDAMDETGKCEVKAVMQELMEEKHFLGFLGDDDD